MPPVITPMGAPASESSGSNPSPQLTPRERAIAKLTGATPEAQSHPVLNPSQVSPEEMGALGQQGQKNTNDSNPSDPEPAPEASEAKPAEEPLSAQYAQLARKEKAIRAKAQELKAQETALKAREAALTAPAQPQSVDTSRYIDREALIKDTFGTLAELGITYDQLTQSQLDQPSPKEVAQAKAIADLKAELAEIRGEVKKTSKTFEDQQTQSYQQAVSQIRSDVVKLVSADPEFETIKETGSVDDVVELIEKTFQADKILLTVEEAAKAVEDHLVEEAMKIARIKKIHSRLNPPKATESPKETAPAAKQSHPGMKTLTNAVGTTRPLTAKERAIAAFKGELK